MLDKQDGTFPIFCRFRRLLFPGLCLLTSLLRTEIVFFCLLFAMQIYATILKKLKTKTVAIMQISSGFCHLAGMGDLVLVQVSHPNNHRPMALSEMQKLLSLVFAVRLYIGCWRLVGLFCLSLSLF